MKDSAGGLVICYLLYHQLGTCTLGGDNQFAVGESGNKRKQVPYLPGEAVFPPYNMRVMVHGVFHVPLFKQDSSMSLSNPTVLSQLFQVTGRSNLGLMAQTNL